MEQFIAAFIGMAVTLCIIGIILFILNAIAEYRIFKKAGESGWKAWIPFLNVYTQYKFSWKTYWFWILMAASVVISILSSKSADNNTYATIALILSIFVWVIQLIGSVKLAKSFGKGTLYGIFMGITFLKTILFFVLAFGSSQYIGNTSDDTPKPIEPSNN